MITTMYDYFFTWAHIPIIGSHNLLISTLGLFNRSLKSNIFACSLRFLILHCSSLWIIFSPSYKRRFHFISIYVPPYPTFQFHFELLLFNILQALRLVGGRSHLCMLYHNYTWLSKQFLVMLNLLVALNGKDTTEKLNYPWILCPCHMDNISFRSIWQSLWHRVDILWWVFGYCLLSPNRGFLEPMLCALGSCYDGVCVLNWSFLLDMHQYNY